MREAIHDEVGPKLFAVAARLSLLKRSLKGKRARELAAAMAELQEARGVARRLAEGKGGLWPSGGSSDGSPTGWVRSPSIVA